MPHPVPVSPTPMSVDRALLSLLQVSWLQLCPCDQSSPDSKAGGESEPCNPVAFPGPELLCLQDRARNSLPSAFSPHYTLNCLPAPLLPAPGPLLLLPPLPGSTPALCKAASYSSF